MLDNIYMTNHAIDRFYQRFNKLVTEKKIHRNEINMKFQHKSKIWNELFLPALENSTDNRSFINDTGRMIYFYEKYGYDTRFKFLDNLELRSRFVLCETNDGRWMIVTVMSVPHEQVKHNHKFNNPKNKLGSKKVKDVTTDDDFFVEDIKRNGDLSDLFKKIDTKHREDERQSLLKKKERDKLKAEFEKNNPHLIGVQSPYKNFEKTSLLWKFDGLKRDQSGCLMSEEMQINKALKLLGKDLIDFKYVAGRVKSVFSQDQSSFKSIGENKFLIEQEFFEYIFEFQVRVIKGAVYSNILSVYETKEVID